MGVPILFGKKTKIQQGYLPQHIFCVSPGKAGQIAQTVTIDDGRDVHKIGVGLPNQLFAAAQIAAGSIEQFRRITRGEVGSIALAKMFRHIQLIANMARDCILHGFVFCSPDELNPAAIAFIPL
ncbi:MAG: hypothetical protein IKM05_01975 [Clostridia bacterium]|nr:hypothetical protein [Clostridia bacterium]MBR6752785.1 hypothetical protein [Clostridia bacterium]